MKKTALITISLLLLMSCMNRHDNIPQQKITEWEATKGKTRVSKMVAHDSLDDALRLIIELEPMRTDDPQIPFIKRHYMVQAGQDRLRDTSHSALSLHL